MTQTQITFADLTTGKSWDYNTERQVRTVAVLYSRQHPRNALRVTVNGRIAWERKA